MVWEKIGLFMFVKEKKIPTICSYIWSFPFPLVLYLPFSPCHFIEHMYGNCSRHMRDHYFVTFFSHSLCVLFVIFCVWTMWPPWLLQTINQSINHYVSIMELVVSHCRHENMGWVNFILRNYIMGSQNDLSID